MLDQEQANTVNSFGVATWLNMNGFRLWGNNTAAYPGISDPKDRWFSVRRFLTWAANTFILTYFQKVDSPANKRLIEAIVDSENVRGNGFVARGVCADLVFRTATVNGAIAVYHIVIADIGEASCKMPLPDLGDGIILPLRRSRAMEDYLVDAPSVR